MYSSSIFLFAGLDEVKSSSVPDLRLKLSKFISNQFGLYSCSMYSTYPSIEVICHWYQEKMASANFQLGQELRAKRPP